MKGDKGRQGETAPRNPAKATHVRETKGDKHSQAAKDPAKVTP